MTLEQINRFKNSIGFISRTANNSKMGYEENDAVQRETISLLAELEQMELDLLPEVEAEAA